MGKRVLITSLFAAIIIHIIISIIYYYNFLDVSHNAVGSYAFDNNIPRDSNDINNRGFLNDVIQA